MKAFVEYYNIRKILGGMEIKIDHSKTKGYVIHKVTDTNYCVCRILNEYDNLDDAQDALVKLLCHKVTEEELLEESRKDGPC